MRCSDKRRSREAAPLHVTAGGSIPSAADRVGGDRWRRREQTCRARPCRRPVRDARLDKGSVRHGPAREHTRFAPWQVELAGRWCRIGVAEERTTGRGVLVRLEGCRNRDQAGEYSGCNIAVERSQFPSLDDGEFYWTDLVGLRVVNTDGADLGRIERMMETGANDVMVVRGTVRAIDSVPDRHWWCSRSISTRVSSSSTGIRMTERWE